MKKYISVTSFRCSVCGAEEKPTEIMYSEFPPSGRFHWGGTCDDCIDAMTPKEREAHRKAEAAEVMDELVQLSQSGVIDEIEATVLGEVSPEAGDE